MELAEFIKTYFPNYDIAVKNLERKYNWRRDGIPGNKYLELYNRAFKEAFINYEKEQK